MKEHIGSEFGSQSTTGVENLCTLYALLWEVSGHPSSIFLVCLGTFLGCCGQKAGRVSEDEIPTVKAEGREWQLCRLKAI